MWLFLIVNLISPAMAQEKVDMFPKAFRHAVDTELIYDSANDKDVIQNKAMEILCNGKDEKYFPKETVEVKIPTAPAGIALDKVQTGRQLFIKAAEKFMRERFFMLATGVQYASSKQEYLNGVNNLQYSTLLYLNPKNMSIFWSLVRVNNKTYLVLNDFKPYKWANQQFVYDDLQVVRNSFIPSVNTREPASVILKTADDAWAQYFKNNTEIKESPSPNGDGIIFNAVLRMRTFCRTARAFDDFLTKEEGI